VRTTSSRPARAFSRWLLTLLPIVLWAPGPVRAAEPAACQPIAKLAGASTLIAPIGRALQARGISPEGHASCRQVAVSVNVRSAGRGYDLLINDPDGRTARRQLPSLEAAALVIESWTRADLASPLLTEKPDPISDRELSTELTTELATELTTELTTTTGLLAKADPLGPSDLGAAAPAATMPAPPDASVHARATDAGATTASAVAGATPAALLLGAETALARDRSLSWGARGGLCLRAGPVCLGLSGRYARAILGATEAAADLERRHEFDVQLNAEIPWRLGPVSIAPMLGVGAGQISSTWRITNSDGTITGRGQRRGRDNGNDHDRHGTPGSGNDGPRGASDGGSPNRRSGDSPPTSSARDSNAVDGTTSTAADERRLLAEAGLRVSLPLWRALALDLGISVGSALVSWGDAEAPRTQLHGGLGLRYGHR
jgi:hypothetical protein